VNLGDKNNKSQAILPNFKGSDQNLTPGKLAYSEMKPRKYTQEIYDARHYTPDHHIYGEQYEMNGSTLDLEYSLLDPQEPLIIDHGIMKFHPGFSVNYVSRWVQVTKSVIRFYNNYYHSVCSFRRPLVVIPMNAVSKIRLLKVHPKTSNSSRVTNRGNKNPYDENQFEIVLKEDYEAIYDLNKRKKEVEDLRYELDLIQKLEYENKLRNKYKQYRSKCRLSKSPAPTFKLFMKDQEDDIKKLSRSHARIDIYSMLGDEEISRYGARSNKSIAHLEPPRTNRHLHPSVSYKY